jgi:hypothetical protein
MTIVEAGEIRAKVKEIATATLKGERVDDVLVEPDFDQLDRDALRITIVLKDRKNLKIEGEANVSIIVATSDFLLSKGDERFPYTRFVTTKELADLNASDD